MTERPLAIIGGTALTDAAWLEAGPVQRVSTPYGVAQVMDGVVAGRRVVFLARHGIPHRVLPPDVNYRANVAALRALDAQRVLATSAVGGIAPGLRVGDLIAVDQLVDLTHGRANTFGERSVDVAEPYCAVARGALVAGGRDVGLRIRDGGTYVCTQGPRYETAAEIRLFASWGMDVVGMTNAPEAFLAREAGLCYASLCVVTNAAAGISRSRLSVERHAAVVREHAASVRAVLAAAVAHLEDGVCACSGTSSQRAERP